MFQFEPSPGSESPDQSEASNVGQGEAEGQSTVHVSQPLGLAPLCQSEEDLINSEDSLGNSTPDDLDLDPDLELGQFSTSSHHANVLDPIVCQGQINTVRDLQLVADDLESYSEEKGANGMLCFVVVL